MTAVLSLVDRPGLATHLAERGLRLTNGATRLVLAAPHARDGLVRVRTAHAGAAILALAPDEAAQVALLDAGAEDVAPIGAGDALIAARLALMAARPAAGWSDRLLRIGSLVIDPSGCTATRSGRPLALLPREHALLCYLAQRPGQAVGMAELLRAVWSLRFDPGTNVVAVHVSRLRAKLDRPFPVPMLRTDRGAGYRLVADIVAEGALA